MHPGRIPKPTNILIFLPSKSQNLHLKSAECRSETLQVTDISRNARYSRK